MGIRFENQNAGTYLELLLSWKSLKEGLLVGVDTATHEEENEITHSLVFFIGPILFVINKGIIG